MRILRQFIAAYVVLTISLASMSVAIVAQRRVSPAPLPVGPLCPTHATHCCCPELCNPPKVSKVEPACHHADNKLAKPGSPTTSKTASCFLKAGCGKDNGVNNKESSLKDFLPESMEGFGTRLTIAPYISALESIQPVGYPSLLFHPPKVS